MRGVVPVAVAVLFEACAATPLTHRAPANDDAATDVALAPPHPAVRRLLRLFGAQEDDPSSAMGRLDEAGCRALTGFRGSDFDRCTLELHANGTAASVGVSYDCGGDSCSADTYVWYGNEPNPLVLKGETRPLEVSPDHRFVLITEIIYSDEIPVPVGGRTMRLDRKTGKRTPFLDCFSARLSPGGKWYVCRDIHANVLKAPVQGGHAELVVRAVIPAGEKIKVGGAFDDYPAPVTFTNAHDLRYELFLEKSGDVLDRHAGWTE